jgi:hypothetical protein
MKLKVKVRKIRSYDPAAQFSETHEAVYSGKALKDIIAQAISRNSATFAGSSDLYELQITVRNEQPQNQR